MAPATIEKIADIRGVGDRVSFAAATGCVSSGPAQEIGTAKYNSFFASSTPPVIDPHKPEPTVYSGADANEFLQKILELIQIVNDVEHEISEFQADSMKYQSGMSTDQAKALKIAGDQVVRLMEEAAKEAEAAKESDGSSLGLGIAIGVFSVLASFATFGIAAAIGAALITGIMLMPKQYNPLDMGAEQVSNLAGGGTWGDIIGQTVMIAALTACVLIGGAGIAAFAEEGAEEAAEEGAEEGGSSFTKQAVRGTAKNIAADAFVQSLSYFNPIGEMMNEAAKACGHDDDGIGTLFVVLGDIVTVVLALVAMKKGCDGAGGKLGAKIFSAETASMISRVSNAMVVLCGVLSGIFQIMTGEEYLKRAQTLEDEGRWQKIYTTLEQLSKMLQSAIQQNQKQSQAVNESFQTISGNFVHLADPFKFLADASHVLA
jgi:hypothetical protein